MEVEQLAHAIENNIPALIQIWGIEVYRWTQEMQPKMTTQLKWLDSNTDHPSYQKRLDQWLTTLHQYERGCDLLVKAEEML
jgi:hypothetical protein